METIEHTDTVQIPDFDILAVGFPKEWIKQQDEITELILKMRQQHDHITFLYSENYLNKEESHKELIKAFDTCFKKIREVKKNYSKQPTDSASGGE